MMKLWKISLAAVYRSVEEGELIGIKLPIENFQVILSLFKKALGQHYHSDYYISKLIQSHNSYVTFNRYAFDLISLMGKNLIKMSYSEFQNILNDVFKKITIMDTSDPKNVHLKFRPTKVPGNKSSTRQDRND